MKAQRIEPSNWSQPPPEKAAEESRIDYPPLPEPPAPKQLITIKVVERKKGHGTKGAARRSGVSPWASVKRYNANDQEQP